MEGATPATVANLISGFAPGVSFLYPCANFTSTPSSIV